MRVAGGAGFIGCHPSRALLAELEPARRLPARRFVVAGPRYPGDIVWPEKVERIERLPPDGHIIFYNAQKWTLNITRADMIVAGYSPSVSLFEAPVRPGARGVWRRLTPRAIGRRRRWRRSGP